MSETPTRASLESAMHAYRREAEALRARAVAAERRINALWRVMEERGSAEFTVWASEQVGCDDLLLDVGPCESLTALLDAIAEFYDGIDEDAAAAPPEEVDG